ncbi:MAG TPA: HU family DNA-binding protein [Deltaproteobacteria bacterium]|nr:HU family DNA-binding protein [Deltaproteobacteria bacterium]
MTKSDLINALAADTGLTKVDADRFLKSFTATVESTLKSGDSLTLIGFGTFSVSNRAARVGRNPQNPSLVINIPASKSAKFKAGSKLKAALN